MADSLRAAILRIFVLHQILLKLPQFSGVLILNYVLTIGICPPPRPCYLMLIPHVGKLSQDLTSDTDFIDSRVYLIQYLFLITGNDIKAFTCGHTCSCGRLAKCR